MFDVERFIEDCRRACAETDPRALQAVVSEAVSDPASVLQALGVPERAGLNTLHCDSGLTVLNLVWGPKMVLHPHDHRMPAVIGLYGGREDNQFYRRVPDGIEPSGTKELQTHDAAILGKDVIHAVTNPMSELTGALHVYAGDFFATPRSEWDPETFAEKPYDVEHTKRVFEESNRLLEDPPS